MVRLEFWYYFSPFDISLKFCFAQAHSFLLPPLPFLFQNKQDTKVFLIRNAIKGDDFLRRQELLSQRRLAVALP